MALSGVDEACLAPFLWYSLASEHMLLLVPAAGSTVPSVTALLLSLATSIFRRKMIESLENDLSMPDCVAGGNSYSDGQGDIDYNGGHISPLMRPSSFTAGATNNDTLSHDRDRARDHARHSHRDSERDSECDSSWDGGSAAVAPAAPATPASLEPDTPSVEAESMQLQCTWRAAIALLRSALCAHAHMRARHVQAVARTVLAGGRPDLRGDFDLWCPLRHPAPMPTSATRDAESGAKCNSLGHGQGHSHKHKHSHGYGHTHSHGQIHRQSRSHHHRGHCHSHSHSHSSERCVGAVAGASADDSLIFGAGAPSAGASVVGVRPMPALSDSDADAEDDGNEDNDGDGDGGDHKHDDNGLSHDDCDGECDTASAPTPTTETTGTAAAAEVPEPSPKEPATDSTSLKASPAHGTEFTPCLASAATARLLPQLLVVSALALTRGVLSPHWSWTDVWHQRLLARHALQPPHAHANVSAYAHAQTQASTQAGVDASQRAQSENLNSCSGLSDFLAELVTLLCARSVTVDPAVASLCPRTAAIMEQQKQQRLYKQRRQSSKTSTAVTKPVPCSELKPQFGSSLSLSLSPCCVTFVPLDRDELSEWPLPAAVRTRSQSRAREVPRLQASVATAAAGADLDAPGAAASRLASPLALSLSDCETPADSSADFAPPAHRHANSAREGDGACPARESPQADAVYVDFLSSAAAIAALPELPPPSPTAVSLSTIRLSCPATPAHAHAHAHATPATGGGAAARIGALAPPKSPLSALTPLPPLLPDRVLGRLTMPVALAAWGRRSVRVARNYNAAGCVCRGVATSEHALNAPSAATSDAANARNGSDHGSGCESCGAVTTGCERCGEAGGRVLVVDKQVAEVFTITNGNAVNADCGGSGTRMIKIAGVDPVDANVVQSVAGPHTPSSSDPNIDDTTCTCLNANTVVAQRTRERLIAAAAAPVTAVTVRVALPVRPEDGSVSGGGVVPVTPGELALAEWALARFQHDNAQAPQAQAARFDGSPATAGHSAAMSETVEPRVLVLGAGAGLLPIVAALALRNVGTTASPVPEHRTGGNAGPGVIAADCEPVVVELLLDNLRANNISSQLDRIDPGEERTSVVETLAARFDWRDAELDTAQHATQCSALKTWRAPLILVANCWHSANDAAPLLRAVRSALESAPQPHCAECVLTIALADPELEAGLWAAIQTEGLYGKVEAWDVVPHVFAPYYDREDVALVIVRLA